MNLDELNHLPTWKEQFFRTPKAEAWKWKEELAIAEKLYNQWRELFGLVTAFAENLPPEEDELLSTKALIYQNAYVIAPKIVSASGDTLYQIKMENAALIRFNCRQMWEQIAFAAFTDIADPAHKEVIEAELDKFRELFSQWVATFRKDEYEDDWGLF